MNQSCGINDLKTAFHRVTGFRASPDIYPAFDHTGIPVETEEAGITCTTLASFSEYLAEIIDQAREAAGPDVSPELAEHLARLECIGASAEVVRLFIWECFAGKIDQDTRILMMTEGEDGQQTS